MNRIHELKRQLVAETLRADRAEAELKREERRHLRLAQLFAERGRENAQLRAQVERAEAMMGRAEVERDAANDVLALVDRQASEYKAERDQLRAQVERMQPVVDAAGAHIDEGGMSGSKYTLLYYAVDAYRASSTQEADNPMTPAEFYAENPELSGEEADA